jgi:peptidoglycan hydrolase CwlO-like protein
MSIEIALLISVVSVSAALFFGLANLRRNQRADAQKDASEMTTVLVKLEGIASGIVEIRGELRGIQNEAKELRDRLIITEQSLKAAWKRIDEN